MANKIKMFVKVRGEDRYIRNPKVKDMVEVVYIDIEGYKKTTDPSFKPIK